MTSFCPVRQTVMSFRSVTASTARGVVSAHGVYCNFYHVFSLQFLPAAGNFSKYSPYADHPIERCKMIRLLSGTFIVTNILNTIHKINTFFVNRICSFFNIFRGQVFPNGKSPAIPLRLQILTIQNAKHRKTHTFRQQVHYI